MIPYFGPLVGETVAFILNVFISPSKALIILILLLCLQIFDGYFLDPKLVGSKVGVRPIWLIFGVVIGGGFLEMDFELQSNLDQPVWNSKTETDITQSPVTLKRLAIFDSSARGYSVHWADNQNSKAKVGDIFGIISEDKKRLEIAIIRRIIMQGQQDYKFGTEVLGV